MLELSLFPTRQYTGTFGVTTPEVSFSMLWTRQQVPRLRPAPRGRGQEDLQRGDRHRPGGDGRPEVQGEKRRGVASQHNQARAAAMIISSHIYLSVHVYDCYQFNTYLQTSNMPWHHSVYTCCIRPGSTHAARVSEEEHST